MDKENKIKVYLADTENEVLDQIRECLVGYDQFEIIGSESNGEKVVADVTAMQPDVLVMEVLLGGIDGFKVFEKCRNQMKENCPKVIFVSNLSHAGFVSKAMKEGASYFMIKPISPDNLAERIIEVVSSQEKKKDDDGEKQLEEKISNIFISIGIPAHIKGYQFLREAVKLAVVEPDIIASITKKLYPTIAEKFETSSSKVERGMRHAIEVAWNRGKIENINNLFGLQIYGANDKPTNGELIALIADKMIMEG